MTDKYEAVCDRLWEKLENMRHILDLDCVDFSKPFPYDQFAHRNPIIKDLVKQVENEFDYGMSENQGSWAVNAFLRWDMKAFNQKTGKSLQPRA